MILFNNNIALPSELAEPSFGFDPDKGKIVLRSRDFRANGNFHITLNNKKYILESGGVLEYTLPAYNKEFSISYSQITDDAKYTSKSYSKKIFLNHPDCIYFDYGDDYESSQIIGYKGTNPRIIIPDKHNLVTTTTANILDFPKVSSSSGITIRTNKYMDTFNIKDYRITDFIIDSENFELQERQFEGLSNLVNITFASTIKNVPYRAFYGCKNLKLDGTQFKKLSSFGAEAFYNTPKIKYFRFSGTSLPSGLFDYPSNEKGVQKVIFTSESSINGFTNKTLPNASYTQGMLYQGNKKHQVFCDVSEALWPSTPATNSNLTFWFHSKSYYFTFTGDNKIIGLDIKAERSSGTEIGHVYLITSNGNPTSTNPGITISGSNRTWKFYYTYLYNRAYPNTSDKITVTPITSTGFMSSTTYTISNHIREI